MKVGLTNIFDLTMGPGQIITDTITIPIQLLQTEDAVKGLNIAEIEDIYINSIPSVFKVRFKNTIYTNVSLHLFGQTSTKPGIILEKSNTVYSKTSIDQQSVDQIVEDLQKQLDEVLSHQVFEYKAENTEYEAENIIQLEVEAEPLKHIDVQLEVKNDIVVEPVVELVVETTIKAKKTKIKATKVPLIHIETPIIEPIIEPIAEQIVVEPVIEPIVVPIVVEPVKTKKTKVKTKKTDDYNDTKVTDLFTENIDLDREDLFNEKI